MSVQNVAIISLRPLISDVIWVQCPSYPKYEASTDGKIRNIKTKHELYTWKPRNGYTQIQLYLDCHRPCIRVKRSVHVVIAETFHGPRPPYHDVHHLDLDKTHSWPANLEYRPVTKNRAEKHCLIRKGFTVEDF
jgi:hypothetical protein